MRRMFVLTIVGGLLPAYFAYPYGFWATSLAYVLGGALFAVLGVLSFMMPWENEERRIGSSLDDDDLHHAPLTSTSEKGPSASQGLHTPPQNSALE